MSEGVSEGVKGCVWLLPLSPLLCFIGHLSFLVMDVPGCSGNAEGCHHIIHIRQDQRDALAYCGQPIVSFHQVRLRVCELCVRVRADAEPD